jgi:hypothetical protein
VAATTTAPTTNNFSGQLPSKMADAFETPPIAIALTIQKKKMLQGKRETKSAFFQVQFNFVFYFYALW